VTRWSVLIGAALGAVALLRATAAASAPPVEAVTAEALFQAAERPVCDPADRVCAAGRSSLALSAFELEIGAAGCTLQQALDACPAAAPAKARLYRVLDAARAAGGTWSVNAEQADLSAEQVARYVDKTLADLERTRCTGDAPICVAGRLVVWVDIDQLTRFQPRCAASAAPAACAQARDPMVRVDHLATAFVKGLIGRIGWPDPRVWGLDTEDKTWLLVQHADDDPAFQRAVLIVMDQALRRGAATGRDYAYLQDRVLVHEKAPQEYGTQGQCGAGGWPPFPIRDPAGVAARRKSVRLDTMADYASETSALCGR